MSAECDKCGLEVVPQDGCHWCAMRDDWRRVLEHVEYLESRAASWGFNLAIGERIARLREIAARNAE